MMSEELKKALTPSVAGMDQFQKVIKRLYDKYPETEGLLLIMVDHLDLFGRIDWRLLHGACEHILIQLQAAKNLSQIEENSYRKFIDNAKELSEIRFKECASDETTMKDLSKDIGITENSAGSTYEYWRYLQAEFIYRVIADFFKIHAVLNFDNIFLFSVDKDRVWDAINPKDKKQVTSWFVAAADYLIEKKMINKGVGFDPVARILAGKAGRELPLRLDREREKKNRNYKSAMRKFRTKLGAI